MEIGNEHGVHFEMDLSDDVMLKSYKIEIHSNFDHHSHGGNSRTVQETVDKVSFNWEQIKTYFNGHIPDLSSFGMKVVLSIVAFYVGTKLIKWLLKVAMRSMEKAGIDMGVAQFICSFGTTFS